MIDVDLSDIDLSDLDLQIDRWRTRGVPHRGWSCVDVIDSKEDDPGGDLDEACEMCSTPIRYVHVMRHPEFAGELRCGCICAGKMEEDYLAARQREAPLKKRSSRRRRSWERRRSKLEWTVVEFRGYQIAVCEQAPHEGRIFLDGREEGKADGFVSVRDAVWSAFREIDERWGE